MDPELSKPDAATSVERLLPMAGYFPRLWIAGWHSSAQALWRRCRGDRTANHGAIDRARAGSSAKIAAAFDAAVETLTPEGRGP